LTPENKPEKNGISQLLTKGKKQGFLLFEEIDKTFMMPTQKRTLKSSSILWKTMG
jgi:hypothetical protein